MADFAPRQILCLVDLSGVSSAVLSWAGLFAGRFQASVEVFHADWSGAPKSPEAEPSRVEVELRETEVYGTLETLAEKVLGKRTAYRITVFQGHPVLTVMARIDKQIPDLIVLGSHGYDGFARVLLGSVAENVVRVAPCPLLIVKGPELAGEASKLGRVVCPVNRTDFARECVEVGSLVAAATGAELNVIQAVEEPGADPERARQQLREWIPQPVRARAKIAEAVLRGEASEQIVAFLRRTAADLVVLGAEHRPLLEFTTLGRTTEQVMRYSPCSVLILPRK